MKTNPNLRGILKSAPSKEKMEADYSASKSRKALDAGIRQNQGASNLQKMGKGRKK